MVVVSCAERLRGVEPEAVLRGVSRIEASGPYVRVRRLALARGPAGEMEWRPREEYVGLKDRNPDEVCIQAEEAREASLLWRREWGRTFAEFSFERPVTCYLGHPKEKGERGPLRLVCLPAREEEELLPPREEEVPEEASYPWEE